MGYSREAWMVSSHVAEHDMYAQAASLTPGFVLQTEQQLGKLPNCKVDENVPCSSAEAVEEVAVVTVRHTPCFFVPCCASQVCLKTLNA
jgi:hypothetical protein